MKIVVAATCVLSLSIVSVRATPQDEQFQQTAHDYIEEYLAANPEAATELGDHRFDDKLSDYSTDARARELERAKQTRRPCSGAGWRS